MSNAETFVADVEAVRLVECGKYRLLSLDVFDTTVWRTFPAPTDLFYSLGYHLVQQGLLYPYVSATSFAGERIEAEREARTKVGRNGEVTLEEIYECFPLGLLRSGTIRAVIDEELALERRSTHPDQDIVVLIDRAVARGMDVAFVSDTYFDENHLRAILPRMSRYLLTSCSFRRPKVHGLHSELTRMAGVKATQILHIGDNLEADVKGPARLGVQTLWRPRYPKPYLDALQSELPNARSERSVCFSRPEGDGGLNAVRAQSVTAAKNWPDPFRSWGSLVAGPLMAGFGKWVGERCESVGLNTALCLMREGRILRQVLTHCAPNLLAHEFFASRYAMIRSTIFEGEVAELAQYLARPRPATAQELLVPLEIDPAEAGLNAETLIHAGSVADLAERIAGTPALRRKARQASANMRGKFLRYLKNSFPNLPERVAIVDLGYSGTIQNHLQAIFEHEGIACSTHGLYFVTGTGIRKIQKRGFAAEGFMAENGQPLSIAHSFMRSPELLEQCLMSPIGSTTGYDDEGTPILGQQHLPAVQLQEIAGVQEGLLDFAERFARASSLQSISFAGLRPFLEAILVRAVTRPSQLELNAFGNWVHDENLGSSKIRRLMTAELDSDYLSHATAHQLASLSSATSYWIFGTAQAQHPVVGEAVRSIFLRKTSPGAFECPEEARTMYCFWNDGEAHRAESKYTLSNRRRAWSRFTLEVRQSDLFEVGFAIGAPGDLISITAVVLRLHQPGRPEEVVRLSLAELSTFGMDPLQGRTATYLVSDIAGFAIPISTVRNFSGQVEIDLLFSLLPAEEPCLS
ncbi:MAG: hypothetical protein ABI811_18880 [Acidobacteriota bacterium]